MRRSFGHYVGGIVGMLGWVFGLTVVCLATGNAGVLVELLPVSLAVSLAMGFGFVVTLEAIRTAYPDDQRLFQLALWGILGMDIGVLLLVCKVWILPVLVERAAERDALEALGALTDVPWGIVIACLTAGAVTSFLAARRALGHA